MYTDASKDQWVTQPEDTVSCSHNVESVNDSAPTDVVEIAVIVWIILERSLRENRDQIHTDKVLKHLNKSTGSSILDKSTSNVEYN